MVSIPMFDASEFQIIRQYELLKTNKDQIKPVHTLGTFKQQMILLKVKVLL